MKTTPIKAGQVHEVRPFPFVRHVASVLNPENDEYEDVDCWKPGTKAEMVPPDSSQLIAEGQGAMRLTVVGVYTPPGFPTRVFYLRQWIDPAGKEFGRRALKVCVASAFRRRANGYAHDYVLNGLFVEGCGFRL